LKILKEQEVEIAKKMEERCWHWIKVRSIFYLLFNDFHIFRALFIASLWRKRLKECLLFGKSCIPVSFPCGRWNFLRNGVDLKNYGQSHNWPFINILHIKLLNVTVIKLSLNIYLAPYGCFFLNFRLTFFYKTIKKITL